jgi:hypothetical protein
MLKYYLGLVHTKQDDWFDRVEVELNDRELLVLRIMLFLCLTGMSYVDFDKLTYHDLENTEDLEVNDTLSFTYIRQKTNMINKVFITLTEDLIEILIKEFSLYVPPIDQKIKIDHISDITFTEKVKLLWVYVDALKEGIIFKMKAKTKKYPEMTHYPRIFPKIHNQHFNEEIKNVLEKIGMTQKVFIIEKRNRKTQKVEYRKCDVISSVTGRRTFITHSLQDGIPIEILMKSTGHTDIRSLLRYNKVDKDEVNKQFLDKKQRIAPTTKWIKKKEEQVIKKPTLKSKKS